MEKLKSFGIFTIKVFIAIAAYNLLLRLAGEKIREQASAIQSASYLNN
jgi:hypothetical protein